MFENVFPEAAKGYRRHSVCQISRISEDIGQCSIFRDVTEDALFAE